MSDSHQALPSKRLVLFCVAAVIAGHDRHHGDALLPASPSSALTVGIVAWAPLVAEIDFHRARAGVSKGWRGAADLVEHPACRSRIYRGSTKATRTHDYNIDPRGSRLRQC